ncbi:MULTISPECIES: CGNR zinc finger domain-containing protein [Paenibacillus]|jgi:predicted RNA-binding Zn ribbon-like protein|uniref:Zinc finger CGNR domain-containing protein n=1 Tax=Paenibacillus azoreducens TaxID=116718 RepID=A0A919YBE6_9BACL|nr:MULTISPECIES: CGNR zinc finger domain-containing protein [Paenibacillus]MBE9918084.1 CGNR zinc finger domain-containing protein [Paenibacillus donghaensis]GIO45442.1 hypothetical protein J34TS1_02070 [Paenibacillus azoreducens]
MGTDFEELEMIADFYNTHDRRMRFENDPGVEHLNRPEDLKRWLERYHLISKEDEVNDQDLNIAIQLRNETRKMIVNNVFDGQGDAADTLKELNELLNSFNFTFRFTGEHEELLPLQRGGRKGLGHLLVLIFELRRQKMWNRIRVCSAADCQWVFVDRSRPGTGKWCTMKACGNRAKNKAYRERKKTEGHSC